MDDVRGDFLRPPHGKTSQPGIGYVGPCDFIQKQIDTCGLPTIIFLVWFIQLYLYSSDTDAA